MTRLEWLAQNMHGGNAREIYEACHKRERMDDIVESATITRDARTVAKERQLTAILSALGVQHTVPFQRGDADSIIPQIMQVSATATGDARDAIQDNATIALTLWNALGDSVYDEHYGQASYGTEHRTPQYTPAPHEEHGFDPYADIFEVQRDLALLEDTP